jgi:enamine deaminase RidA (YjgF/YER057c/UK114 family)
MLASVGSDLEHVVHVSVFLGSLSDFEAMNEVGSIDEARTSRKFSPRRD